VRLKLLKKACYRTSKEFFLQLSLNQIQLQQLGTDKSSVIRLEEAQIELLTKIDGTQYIKIILQDGNVIEVRRVNPTKTVSLKDTRDNVF
jgi:hypothetical protein